MPAQSPPLSKILTSAFVVTGFMVGAGMLAIPVNLGPSGFLPAVLCSLLVWLAMTGTGLIIAHQPFWKENPGADMPSLYEAELGRAGKWLSVAANLLILYGMLTAYLAGVSTVAVHSFDVPLPEWAVMLLYFCVVTLMASMGDAALRRGNAVLVTTMWLLFGALLVLVAPHFRGVDLGAANVDFLSSGVPILLVAFIFHNMVPTVCHSLDNDRRAIDKALWIGSGIALAMTMIWTVAVLLTLPVESSSGGGLISAFKAGQPATIPLDKLIRSPLFVNLSIAFSVVAMSTSYMGVGAGLLGFVRDLAGHRVRSRLGVWLLAFMPPLLVGEFYPDAFLRALNVVGGVGITTLFGLLPGVMLVRQGEPGSRKRLLGWFLLVLFVCVLAVELGQELGLLRIDPDVEYWSHHSYNFGGH